MMKRMIVTKVKFENVNDLVKFNDRMIPNINK